MLSNKRKSPILSVLLFFISVSLFFSCIEPADEVLSRTNEGGALLFVSENSVGRNNNNAMKSNRDEFYPGSDISLLSPISPSGEVRNLTQRYTRGSSEKDIGAASDPEISYDGKKVLFSMREQGRDNKWRLYEMDLNGDNLVALTTGTENFDDMDPAYVTDSIIVFTSSRPGFVDEYERRQSPVLHVGEKGADGRLHNIRQISFNQSHDMNPIVHSSGKVYFCRWEHVGDINKVSIFAVNPDGTGLFVLYGSHTPTQSGSRAFVEIREMFDGRLAAAVMERNSAFEGGAIAAIDISKSEDNLDFITGSESPFNNTRDTAVAVYKTPYPIKDGGKERIIVAMSPHAVGGGVESSVDYGLYVMDKDGNNRKLVYNNAGMNEVDPVYVTSREKPKNDYFNPLVKTATSKGVTSGKFFDANVYSRGDVDRQMHPDVNWINHDGSKGQAKYVRVLEAIPLPFDGNKRGGAIGNTSFEKQKVIGYGDVRSDGSFSIEVPAGISMHLQTLDENGVMLVNQLTWVHVMPGEQRLCTGCHGSHDQDKEIFDLVVDPVTAKVSVNKLREFLSGFDNADVVIAHSAATLDTVDFYRLGSSDQSGTIQSIFRARCYECHSATKAAGLGGGLVLEETSDKAIDGVSSIYESLTEAELYKTVDNKKTAYAHSYGARFSPLAWVLLNKQLDKKSPAGANTQYRPTSYDHTQLWEKDSSGFIHPFLPGNKDLLRIIEWMDMGAQYSNTVGKNEYKGM